MKYPTKKLQIVSILSRINDAAKKEAEVVAEVTEVTWSGDIIKSIKFIFVWPKITNYNLSQGASQTAQM